jgi:hypothetical protein
MNRSKGVSFFPVLLLAVFSVSSCSGVKTMCTVNCGVGNGTVAVTMVADTLPANPSLLTFQVTISSITFTPLSGVATTVNLSPALTVDLMRLQSDTVFLGTSANIPAGQYTSVTLTISGNANITFLNDTNATVSLCAAGAICPLSVAASSLPVATVSFTVTQNAVTGIGIDLNFANAVSITGTTLVVNLANKNVLSGFTLPRQGSNLAASQFDLIEDFTGVVSITNQSVTLASAPAASRGSLTAAAVSGTIYDHDPSGTLCPTGTTQLTSCVSNNQFASMDIVLKSDGTLAIQEIEPLLATVRDTVEGIVGSINQSNQTQFTIVVTDMVPAVQGSLIGSLKIGDRLTVNLSNVGPFLVDTKGLSVLPGSMSNFSGQTTTGAMHLGQTVAVHVTTFTAAVGNTIASASTDTVTLRWSRFSATPQNAASPAFSIVNFPSYFVIAPGTLLAVQTTPGTPGTAGITNFDGIADGSGLNLAKPVALRALFLQDTTNTANPALFAAKVRQH